VQALDTLVSEDGNAPMIPGFADKARPLPAAEKAMIADAAKGLVAGYTGPGGKTILGHRAVAKIDLRLVPDMTAAESLAALKAHLAKQGFGDITLRTSTS